MATTSFLRRLVRCSAALAACWGLLIGGSAMGQGSGEVQLLLKVKNQLPAPAVAALLKANSLRPAGEIPALGVRVVRVSAAAAAKVMAALSKHKDVEYVEPDAEAKAVAAVNDPGFPSQWHLATIQAPAAWDLQTGSEQLQVAVIDTGVNAAHPDAGRVAGGYDFVNGDADATDDNGHGTAVAGCISPVTNNALGIAGLSWNSVVLPVKVLDASGSGSYSAIANGIIYAADWGARIINLSLGGTSNSTTLQNAVNYAWNKGCVIVAAAGNNGNSTAFYPAACNNVVAVSATRSNDTRPTWSNYGAYVDLSAPGENIWTLDNGTGYRYISGTSFSSPIVAGVLALMASTGPRSNAELVELLLTNVDDIGTAGYDTYYGYGRVNAFRAVQATAGFVGVDATAPQVSILSPAAGSAVSGTIDIRVTATDNVAVERLELWLNGAKAGESPGPSVDFTVDTRNYADGLLQVEVRGVDAAGNVGSASQSLQVMNAGDTTAPVATITSPKNGAVIKGKTVNVGATSSDNVGFVRLELYIDGALYAASSTSSATFKWNLSGYAKGTHTLQLVARDQAGNAGVSSLVSVTLR